MMVPQNVGGTNDIVGRIVAQKLGEVLGGSVVIENRPGAGGNIGTAQAAKAPRDGYSLMMTVSSAQAINPALYKNPGFDPVRDFTPISLIGAVPNVLVVNPAFPARTLKEFIEVTRAKPKFYQYASAGNGTLNHLLGEMLGSYAGVQLQHVPYKGIAPALNDVLGGLVPIAFATPAAVLQHLKSGRLVALVGLTLPFALVGGVLATAMGDRILSLGTLVGLLTVLGIAARNGILMINHFQHLERYEGEVFGRALVVRGAKERLSPILMTSLAAGIGVLPLVVAGTIPGNEIEHPMAVAILGGLVTSTVLNLFVVPALYLRFARPMVLPQAGLQAAAAQG